MSNRSSIVHRVEVHGPVLVHFEATESGSTLGLDGVFGVVDKVEDAGANGHQFADYQGPRCGFQVVSQPLFSRLGQEVYPSLERLARLKGL